MPAVLFIINHIDMGSEPHGLLAQPGDAGITQTKDFTRDEIKPLNLVKWLMKHAEVGSNKFVNGS